MPLTVNALVKEVVYNRDDRARRYCCQDHVVIDAHPVMSVGRAMQSIAAVVMHDVSRRVVR